MSRPLPPPERRCCHGSPRAFFCSHWALCPTCTLGRPPLLLNRSVSRSDLEAVPGELRRMIRLCLQRDPRQRLRDISGARLLLDEPAAAAARAPLLPWLAAGVLLLALGAVSYLHFGQAPAAAQPIRFEIGFGGCSRRASPNDPSLFAARSTTASPRHLRGPAATG